MGVADSLRGTISNTSYIILSAPSGTMRVATRTVTPFVGGGTITMYTSGNLTSRTNRHLSRVVSRGFSSMASQVIILSKPGRTRRINLNLPTTAITTSRIPRTMRVIRSIFVQPIFHMCHDSSVHNMRCNNTLGGVMTLTYNIRSKVNLNSGYHTTLVAQKLIRVTEFNIRFNTHQRAFFNLSKVNSLITAYADARDHGRETNLVLKGKGATGRVYRKARVIIRKVHATFLIGRVTERRRVGVPVARRIYHLLRKRRATRRTLRGLVAHTGGTRVRACLRP